MRLDAQTMKFYQLWVTLFRWLWLHFYLVTGASLALGISVNPLEQARGATSITPTNGAGDLGTTITQHNNVYGIREGTPVGNNLFHSFSQFNIGSGDTAQFQTATLSPNTATHNIFGRVTGGSASSIFGAIDSATFYPSASLFLMNPAGIIFGQDATLNIGGTTHFTTADYLHLNEINGSNSGIFHGSTQPTSVLTSAPVAAFGFVGPNPAAISVQGTTLAMKPGQFLSLVGGNKGFTYTNPDTNITASVPGGITITGGKLSTEGGQINITSVASSGELSLVDSTPNSAMTRGDIDISLGSTLDVSGDEGGTVRIRGGRLTLTESTISADTNNFNGPPTAIDIRLVGNFLASNTISSTITARTTGAGNSGNVKISSGNLTTALDSLDISSFIDTHTSGTGKAGNVSITTGNLQAIGNSEGLISFIYSGTEGPGHGGDVTITARNIQIEKSPGGITTGNFIGNLFGKDVTGSAGNVTISADSLKINFSQIETDAFSFANNTGQSGNISIKASDISLDNSAISSQGHDHGGAITIQTGQLMATDSQILVQSNLTDGGAVNLTAKDIELSKGSSIVSSTGGNGSAGSVTIVASNHLRLLGSSADRPSGIFSNSFGTFGNSGNSGDVAIRTPRLDITGGARINTASATNGHGGNVTIDSDTILVSGQLAQPPLEPIFGLGNQLASGIFTSTITNTPISCVGICGNAGNVSISTGSLVMSNGAHINSGTSSSGGGGNIDIRSANTISISGTLADGSPVGIFSRSIGMAPDAGAGGNISLTARQSVTIQAGASISAASTGPGNAGNVGINAGQQLEVRDSPNAITTQAAKASGGNIDIRAIDLIRFENSTISTSVLGGDGTGGNIFIDPKVVILQGSNVTAQAVGGTGGQIKFVTPLFLADSASTVSASSQRGPNGTVTIQSPTANLSSAVGQLVSKMTPPQVLLQSRCVALTGGGQSTFIVAGREKLPAEPGGWLNSPISMDHWTGENQAHAAGLMVQSRGSNVPRAQIIPKDEPTVFSLRRLTPPGFLVRAFASPSTGCPS